MTPLAHLKKKRAQTLISPDENQWQVMRVFDQLYDQLVLWHKKVTWFGRLGQRKPPLGIYLWGNVGSGKTFIMDTFFDCLVFGQKWRLHFHRFMQWVHTELKKKQGQKNPLVILAKGIAKKANILCLDEFFVSDIADAMLLSGLLDGLFRHQVVLITTSNCHPDNLYRGGMLRERFLPAIALIKQHTRIINLSTRYDYRLHDKQLTGFYYTPLNDQAHQQMEHCFHHWSAAKPYLSDPVTVLGRDIPVIKRTPNVIWFDFKVICGKPRSQNDYLRLAQDYHTMLISHVPVIAPDQEDTISYFIKLVDIFYDQHIRLILSAASHIKALYPEGPLWFEYQRTQSRLIEMQSKGYVDR